MCGMSRFIKMTVIVLTAGLCLGVSSIDPVYKFAWSENAGWLNWRDADGGVAGVVVHGGFVSGFIWGENLGWINVGDGTPLNNVHYDNLDDTDFGVNIDTNTGDLFGLAWAENVGWINFDTLAELGPFNEQARYDATTGIFSGYAWGENIGWVSLDSGTVHVGVMPVVTAAASRRMHGAAPFDIAITSPAVVECRAAGPTRVLVTFDRDIAGFGGLSNDDVALSAGAVGGLSISGSVLTIDLAGTTNTQPLTISFPGIVDLGDHQVDGSLCFRVLAGDVTGDGNTNVLDLVNVRNNLNQAATAANFRSDVTADGGINVLDLVNIRNNLNLTATPCP